MERDAYNHVVYATSYGAWWQVRDNATVFRAYVSLRRGIKEAVREDLAHEPGYGDNTYAWIMRVRGVENSVRTRVRGFDLATPIRPRARIRRR